MVCWLTHWVSLFTEQVTQVVDHWIYIGWLCPHSHAAVRPGQHDKGLPAACGSGYGRGVACDYVDVVLVAAQLGIVLHARQAARGTTSTCRPRRKTSCKVVTRTQTRSLSLTEVSGWSMIDERVSPTIRDDARSSGRMPTMPASGSWLAAAVNARR